MSYNLHYGSWDTISNGSRDGATGFVESLQRMLPISGNYNPGSADGVFGQNTESSVIAYQEYHNLAVDGVVGNETWTQLNFDATNNADGTQTHSGAGSGSLTLTMTFPGCRGEQDVGTWDPASWNVW